MLKVPLVRATCGACVEAPASTSSVLGVLQDCLYMLAFLHGDLNAGTHAWSANSWPT